MSTTAAPGGRGEEEEQGSRGRLKVPSGELGVPTKWG